jgi:hypothetical protein
VRLTSRQSEPDREAIVIDQRMILLVNPPRDVPWTVFCSE